jgi:hypothetical protein
LQLNGKVLRDLIFLRLLTLLRETFSMSLLFSGERSVGYDLCRPRSLWKSRAGSEQKLRQLLSIGNYLIIRLFIDCGHVFPTGNDPQGKAA